MTVEIRIANSQDRVMARSAATKQSSFLRCAKAGLLRGACHRARIRATRWLAMTNSHTFAIPRHLFARVLLSTSRPLQAEGAGNAGRPVRPIAACAEIVVERTRVSQVTPESPGIPHAMVYGLCRALPGDRLFCHRRRRNCFHRLDTSVGVPGPHVFAVRFRAVRYRRIRVHRIPPPTSCDDRETPLNGGGTTGI